MPMVKVLQFFNDNPQIPDDMKGYLYRKFLRFVKEKKEQGKTVAEKIGKTYYAEPRTLKGFIRMYSAPDGYVRISDYAKAHNIREGTIRRRVTKGKYQSIIKISGVYHVNKSELDADLAAYSGNSVDDMQLRYKNLLSQGYISTQRYAKNHNLNYQAFIRLVSNDLFPHIRIADRYIMVKEDMPYTEYVTIHKYAQMHDVLYYTMKQAIEAGKSLTAKKGSLNSRWYIDINEPDDFLNK